MPRLPRNIERRLPRRIPRRHVRLRPQQLSHHACMTLPSRKMQRTCSIAIHTSYTGTTRQQLTHNSNVPMKRSHMQDSPEALLSTKRHVHSRHVLVVVLGAPTSFFLLRSVCACVGIKKKTDELSVA